MSLLSQEPSQETSEGNRSGTFAHDHSKITIIIVEDNEKLSSPQRIVLSLTGVSLIYEAVAAILGENANDLAVVSCDSGSDKSFELMGIQQVIAGAKEIILAIWDRVVMYRHSQMDASISLIASSLPVLENLKDLQDNGSLAPEQAELIRRKIIDGATKFMDSGTITEEMNQHSSQSPRLLMRPQQRLLVAPTLNNDYTTTNSATSIDVDDAGEISSEFDDTEV